jgi:hypothetical protein
MCAFHERDRVDAKDLAQMFIGSLAVLTIYMQRAEYKLVNNLQVVVFVVAALAALKGVKRVQRGLPAFGSAATSHMVYGFLMSLLVSVAIGWYILDYDFLFTIQVAIGVLPATLLLDVLAGE